MFLEENTVSLLISDMSQTSSATPYGYVRLHPKRLKRKERVPLIEDTCRDNTTQDKKSKH